MKAQCAALQAFHYKYGSRNAKDWGTPNWLQHITDDWEFQEYSASAAFLTETVIPHTAMEADEYGLQPVARSYPWKCVTCGIYAEDFEHMWRNYTWLVKPDAIGGLVELKGKVVQHERGYRASEAEVVEFWYLRAYPLLDDLHCEWWFHIVEDPAKIEGVWTDKKFLNDRRGIKRYRDKGRTDPAAYMGYTHHDEAIFLDRVPIPEYYRYYLPSSAQEKRRYLIDRTLPAFRDRVGLAWGSYHNSSEQTLEEWAEEIENPNLYNAIRERWQRREGAVSESW